MQNRRLVTLGCVAAITVLTMPGTAAAATFTALKPCYVALSGSQPQTELINVAGNGFVPGVPVDVDVDGKREISGAPVDPAGNLGADPVNPILAPSPFLARGDKPFAVVASQNGQPVASGPSRVTALSVSLSPRRSRPSRSVTFTGRGFTGKGKVYAHYRFQGRTRRTVTFTPKGPCGTFTARKRQIPVTNPGTGTWTIQFDHQEKYARTPASVYVRLTIVVTRTVRFNRAATARTAGARVVAAGLGA